MRTLTSLLALTLTLATGCWSVNTEPDGGTPSGQQDTADGGGSGGASGGRYDASNLPPAEGSRSWVLVNDTTEGLSVGGLYGTDVDAIDWVCPSTEQSGHAVEVAGIQQPPGAGHSMDPALGEADGPCDPVSDCAAPLGPQGWIALRTTAFDLAGCEVTVHELHDRADERFEVYACVTGALDETCTGPHFQGQDGQSATGTIGDR